MEPATILIADDDAAIRTVLNQALGRLGHEVRVTGSVASLWQWINEGEGDLVITDVLMPDGNGLDLIPQIKKRRPELRVIAMSAQNTLSTAVKANERGAFEYLPKPFDLNELLAIVQRGLDEPTGSAKPSETTVSDDDEIPLIGRSAAMQTVYRAIARLTATDLSVLISGESGTGKELVARALHDFSNRKGRPFVAINMAAIPRELIESELFGHEKGAFTGATTRYSGRFEQARGGTLFLDEIGDMPMDAQTRLLRVLQEGEYTTVGGRTPIKTDVRVISATHRDLKRQVSQGLFREDLYYRLNVVPIRLPPLRDRREDIPDLVSHFLAQSVDLGLSQKTISTSAMQALQKYGWPGNVRELENLVRRLAALSIQDTISEQDAVSELAEAEPSQSSAFGSGGDASLGDAVEHHLRKYFESHDGDFPTFGLYGRVLREIERPLLSLTLSATNGNQLKAADILGLNRNTLRKKVRDLEIAVVRTPKSP